MTFTANEIRKLANSEPSVFKREIEKIKDIITTEAALGGSIVFLKFDSRSIRKTVSHYLVRQGFKVKIPEPDDARIQLKVSW